jgi:hypothetical protein
VSLPQLLDVPALRLVEAGVRAGPDVRNRVRDITGGRDHSRDPRL